MKKEDREIRLDPREWRDAMRDVAKGKGERKAAAPPRRPRTTAKGPRRARGK